MNTKHAAVVVLASALGGGLAGCASDVTESDLEKIAIKLPEVRTQVEKGKVGKDVLLLDARARSDFEARHLPGATNMGVTGVSGVRGDTSPQLAKYKTIVVYGEDPGSASARALAKKMLATGYKNVRFFPEGMMGWEGAKLPVESK